jgi:hypothetical protein
LDADPVRGIGEDHIRQNTVEQGSDIGWRRSVSAEEAMIAE